MQEGARLAWPARCNSLACAQLTCRRRSQSPDLAALPSGRTLSGTAHWQSTQRRRLGGNCPSAWRATRRRVSQGKRAPRRLRASLCVPHQLRALGIQDPPLHHPFVPPPCPALQCCWTCCRPCLSRPW